MTLHYQTVLFDLDGTLTDPREGITRSIQYALGKLGIDEPDLTQLEHFIGPPLLQAFMQFYGFDEAKAWEAVNFYRERFKVTGLYENRVFEGVMPLLEDLSGQGRQLYVATSKPWVFAREIARHFDFAKHFKVIYGSELEGLDPATTLMIGDRKHDLIGAHSNGLDSAAVGYGFGSFEELNAEAPTWHFETLAEMHQAFMQRS